MQQTDLTAGLAQARTLASRRFADVEATLEVTGREIRDAGLLRREAEFTLIRPGHPPETRTVFWEIESPLDIPSIESIDFAAVATLFVAMKHRARLHLRGAVTNVMLRNLEELNEAWNQVLPQRYHLIPIHADAAAPVPAHPMNEPRAVLAFSGGLDAAFTLVRHLSKHSGHRSADIATALLVHGFDIPLSAPHAFAAAAASARESLENLGLNLSVVRTNWRDVAETDWEIDHMAAISACMHNFSGACQLGLMSSDLTYLFNYMPWGSNPSTDHFFSGGALTIRPEGQAFLRTERAELVAAVPALAERIRVCWAGPITGKNCGRCEKCIRTQLNFLAARADPGPAFPVRATWRDVLCVNAPHAAAIRHLYDICNSARRNNVSGAWLYALAINWAINRTLLPIRPYLHDPFGILKALRRAFIGKRVTERPTPLHTEQMEQP